MEHACPGAQEMDVAPMAVPPLIKHIRYWWLTSVNVKSSWCNRVFGFEVLQHG